MAKITVENAEVVRHLSDKGYVIQTTYTTRNNDTRKETWTVWGQQPPLGSIVTVTGLISVKLDEWDSDDGRVKVARGHINNPEVQSSPQPADPMKDLPQQQSFDDQVPF